MKQLEKFIHMIRINFWTQTKSLTLLVKAKTM